MTSNLTFDLRLVAYTPLGARIGVVPDAGITITGQGSGSTLQATVSTANLGALTSVPTQLEVAVEWWHQSTQQWQEGRDGRFFITQQTYDDRDRTGIYQLTGMNIGAYFMGKAALAGVEPYVNTTGTSETAQSKTNVSVSGTTFTWASHVLAAGDRVRIVAKGSAKSINTGSVYYVKNPTASTFQLARGNATSAAINAGTASNINMARVVTRIVFTGSHQFTKSQAISVVGGTALGLTDGSEYYVANPTTATIQITDKPGGTPLELKAASTNVTQVYRYLDGQRVFTNAHPGTVLSSAFLEARGRGWGVGADGSTQLLHGWTTTTDSTGAAWSKMADDPETPGVSVGFQPGTPMSAMLQFMLDNQYAEWYTSNGRTIHAVNYGTGNDHSVDATPMRIGTTASSVPVTVDLSAMSNSWIIRGTGSILLEQDAVSYGNVGKLETYETSSGSTTKTLATKQAKTDLAANQNGQIGYQVTENASEAAFIPLKDFSRGDWVAVQLAGTGWTKLRVIGWAFTKAANGMITVTSTLQYQKKSALVQAVTAHTGSSASISDGGTTTSPILESDNRKPAAPVVTAVTSTGLFGNDDSAQSIATVTWNPVSSDISGMDIVTTEYNVWIRPEGALNGTSAGETAGLTLDIYGLQPGVFYLVTVRALSADGSWGEFSNEFEFQTAFPVLPPNQPTTPSLTSSLAGVRVAWDGNVLDQDGVTPVAPAPGFAYVYVLRATSAAAITGGTGTVVGTNMGNAGYAVDTGLTVGATYYYALVAVNTVGNASVISGIASVVIVGVSGPDIAANTVTANNILAGAITSDKLDIGTVPASANPVDRVPLPLANSNYWAMVIAGTIALPDGHLGSVSAGSTGVTFNGTPTTSAQLGVTAKNPVPGSGAVYISILSTSGLVFPQVTEFNAAGANIGTHNIAAAVNGVRYSFTSTAAFYTVKLTTSGGLTQTDTVTSCHVFEVISTMGQGQGVELSPAGLQFYDANGNLQMDLTTGSSQLFGVFDSSGGDPVAQAFVSQAGDAFFNGALTVNGNAAIDGVLLTDQAAPNGILNSNPNGSTWDPNIVPLLDRFPRGVVYDVTWATMEAVTQATQYKRIAQDQFTLEDGRNYEVVLQLAGLQTDLTASDGGSIEATNTYIEMQFALVPNTSVSSGTPIMRAVIYSNNRGTYALPPTIWAASANQSVIDFDNRTLPAGVPIYWQVNSNLSAVPSRTINFHEFGNVRGLSIIDIGSTNLTRPVNGADTLAATTDRTATGTSSGNTSGGTTATSKTVTFTAHSSRTWNNGGSSIVSGSGQYTNGAAMYYGTGASAMGSWFGNFQTSGGSSLATILSGKTVSKAVLTVENTYTAFSTATVTFGTAATTTAPATIGSPVNNTWNSTFSQGQKKAITLSGTIASALASGGVGSFVLGVSSSSANYSYYHGATQSTPPTLTVTYH